MGKKVVCRVMHGFTNRETSTLYKPMSAFKK